SGSLSALESASFSPLSAGRGAGGVGLREQLPLPDARGSPATLFFLPEGGVGPSRALLCALLLLVAGTAVYLPVTIISGRYAMPAVWGLDILLALLLAALAKLPAGGVRTAAWAAV